MALPGRGDRVLFLIPHPDDETLATGGLIQQALARGAEVRVVLVTSGDAFSIIAHRLFPREPFAPALFTRLGRMRMEETRVALRRLGLPSSQLTFWGYPDTGLERLLTVNWPKSLPWTARRTGASRSPYGNRSGTNYSGESLLSDVERALREWRPTLLVYPHPGDFNRDHRTIAAVVEMALCRLATRADWKPPREATYLVHWGESWPSPFQADLNADPAPPPPMELRYEAWAITSMTPRQANLKRDLMAVYRSQAVSPRETIFMAGFVRRGELFSLARRGTPLPNGAAFPEPIESRHSARFTPAGDLMRLRVVADAQEVRVRFLTRSPVTRPLVCRVDTRTVEPEGVSRWLSSVSPPASTTLTARETLAQPFGAWRFQGNIGEWRFPRSQLHGATALLVGVTLSSGRWEVDHSTWRVWNLALPEGERRMTARRSERLSPPRAIR